MSYRRPRHPTAHVEFGSGRHVDNHSSELQRPHADDHTRLDALRDILVGHQVRTGLLLQESGGAGLTIGYNLQRRPRWIGDHVLDHLL